MVNVHNSRCGTKLKDVFINYSQTGKSEACGKVVAHDLFANNAVIFLAFLSVTVAGFLIFVWKRSIDLPLCCTASFCITVCVDTAYLFAPSLLYRA